MRFCQFVFILYLKLYAPCSKLVVSFRYVRLRARLCKFSIFRYRLLTLLPALHISLVISRCPQVSANSLSFAPRIILYVICTFLTVFLSILPSVILFYRCLSVLYPALFLLSLLGRICSWLRRSIGHCIFV